MCQAETGLTRRSVDLLSPLPATRPYVEILADVEADWCEEGKTKWPANPHYLLCCVYEYARGRKWFASLLLLFPASVSHHQRQCDDPEQVHEHQTGSNASYSSLDSVAHSNSGMYFDSGIISA